MRSIDFTEVFKNILEDGVDAELAGNRHVIYVDISKVDQIPAGAIMSGKPDRKNKLDELYGYLRNHVEPFNKYTEHPELTGRRRREYDITRFEVHAVENIEEVACGEAPRIKASAGDPVNRGRKNGSPRVPLTGGTSEQVSSSWRHAPNPAEITS